MVGRHGFEPWNPKEQISLPLQLSLPPLTCLQSGLSLNHIHKNLGSSYKVSTLGINLARDCHINICLLSFPRISDVHLNCFQLRVQLEDINIFRSRSQSAAFDHFAISPKKWCRQRESNSQPTDSYYYSFHYHLCVCSLDFLLTIFIRTQVHRIKSLHSVLTQLGIDI